MRTAKVKLYAFEELSDEAKKRAHANWLNEGHYHFWAGDARATIRAFESEFGVTIRNWHYDSSGYGYDIDFGDISDEVLELSGNRARAWIWNNHGDILLEPSVSYLHDSVRRRSRVFFDRVYDGTCPFTGVCFDCDALDPIAYFAFGVEWSEKEKRRVASSRRLAADDATTIMDLIDACVDSLFKSLRKDCEEQETIEYFAEHCAANDYEFDEDGELWTGKEVAA